MPALPEHDAAGDLRPDMRPALAEIAEAASAAILKVRARGIVTRVKADQSPVTEADLAANALIVARLRALDPGTPIVAEESTNAAPEALGPRFWMVDPLDGTKEFVAGRDEFTVNIALIVDRRPVLGLVGLPVQGIIYAGDIRRGAWRRVAHGGIETIAARACPHDGATVVASRSHFSPATEDWLANKAVARIVHAGSSLKFCRIAEGAADLYPRLGRTMEWDTAAGHAVLAAAGGTVTTLEGAPLAYAKPGFENPDFVARGAL